MTTEKLVLEMKAEASQLKRELDAVNKKIKTAEESTKDYREENQETEKGMGSMAGKAGTLAKGVAKVGVAVAAGTAALVAYATAQGRAIQETQALATMAGVTVEEFERLSFVYGTVGINAEKFGDITKDVQERIGEFQNAGTGAFQDVADALGLTSKEALALSGEFEKMSGQEVLQEVVNRMEDAGKSSQEMSAVLEALASDTTRLIPLLRDGGKAADELSTKFRQINVGISEEEREQFKELAENVDLAQSAFINFANKGIAQFLPAINSATEAFAGFFSEYASRLELEDILENEKPTRLIEGLNDVNKLYQLLNASRDRMSQVENWQYFGVDADTIAEEEQNLSEVEQAIQDRLDAIETLNAKKNDGTGYTEDGLVGAGGGETTTTTTTAATGLDQATLKAELEAYQDSKRSKLQVLEDERTDSLAIAATMAEGSQKRIDTELEIQARYNEQVAALKAEEQAVIDEVNAKKEAARKKEIDGIKAELQAHRDSQASKLELLAKDEEEELARLEANAASAEEHNALKLEVERKYQEQRRAIIDELSPETFDNDVVQERYDQELEQLQEHLNNKLLSEEEYLAKVNALKKKSAEDDKKTTDQTVKWEGTATKKQIDQGIQLLDAVGGNSKKLFKVKQGLSAGNAVMNTSEGVTKALAEQNYAGATVTALTGAAQLAAILSAKPDGGGGTIAPASAASSGSTDTGSTFTGDATSTTITDITELTDSGQSTERFIIEFSDDVIDAVARKVKQSENDGRV